MHLSGITYILKKSRLQAMEAGAQAGLKAGLAQAGIAHSQMHCITPQRQDTHPLVGHGGGHIPGVEPAPKGGKGI